MGNLMSIFFPKAAAPAPLEQVATQGGEPTVVSLQLHHRHGPGYHGHGHHGHSHMVIVIIL